MNLRQQIKNDLGEVVKEYSKEVNVQVARTADSKFGDYSSNVALQIGHKLEQSPMEIAKKIADNLGALPYVLKLEVKEPGFVNFFVKDSVWQDEVKEVLKKGVGYGSVGVGNGKKARVEFVSANPTGPLHFGNARGGPIGDSLASVLEFSGYRVVREYIHNDIGTQVKKLGESIVNVAAGDKLEDQEYKGDYIRDLAGQIVGKTSDKLQITNAEEVGKAAVEILLMEAIADSEKMGITFDEVHPESDFMKNGQTEKALEILDKKGFLKNKDGAKWFAPSDEFLKDRETVVVKSDGSYTYFANDIAYHSLKFSEKPDLVIDIFGSNHHGHIPRLQAAVSALGYDAKKFHVILYQWVRFKRAGEAVKMSKRSGTFITAREVLDEIGKDAVRFFILMHDASSPIDFDLDLAREKSTKNPVYYVQYAHARICSILAKSKVKSQKSKVVEANLSLLLSEYELNLLKQISRLPELVEDIAGSFAVHHLTSYAQELADAFHKFYENCKVVGEEERLMEARISLLFATKTALENTLKLLGVSAPEKM